MSFKSILSAIAGVGSVAGPIVSIFNPPAGLILTGVFKGITAAEQNLPDASGTEKKTAVMSTVELDLLPELNAELKKAGKKLVLTPDTLSKFSGATDHLVAASKEIAAILETVEDVAT